MGTIARRVFLFICLNAFVLLTITLILSLFHVQPYMTQYGLDLRQLLIFCAVWGIAGSFISLALSRIMAKWMMGVQLIDADTTDPQERRLLQMVYQIAQKANLPKMPEVGIYDSSETNAFATGPSRSRALVAVSSGLLSRMNWNEIEGVLGHEITHISNGDMVTMTLLQGVVNAFVMFFARVIAFAITRMGKKSDSQSEEPSPLVYNLLVFVLEIVFMILGAIVIAAFSRYREFKADKGGSRLAGKENMISALRCLQSLHETPDPKAEQPAFQALKISNKKGILHLFSSHPPLEVRIQRLEEV